MPDTLTKNERDVLRSARDTKGLKFETWAHNKTVVTVVDHYTVVTGLTIDLAITLEARGYIEHVRAPHVYRLTEDGKARAARIRPARKA